MKRCFTWAWITGLCVCSLLAWSFCYFRSPAWNKDLARERAYLRQVVEERAPDLQGEKTLAQAYWFRYPDVRQHAIWGERGVMGIRGPRDHYRHHGREEGRVFGPLTQPPDPVGETDLAEAYWQRYPEIGGNSIWGRQGTMGVLGARDHYYYYGKAQGRSWGLSANKTGEGK